MYCIDCFCLFLKEELESHTFGFQKFNTRRLFRPFRHSCVATMATHRQHIIDGPHNARMTSSPTKPETPASPQRQTASARSVPGCSVASASAISPDFRRVLYIMHAAPCARPTRAASWPTSTRPATAPPPPIMHAAPCANQSPSTAARSGPQLPSVQPRPTYHTRSDAPPQPASMLRPLFSCLCVCLSLSIHH
jgi:hypothetical protein